MSENNSDLSNLRDEIDQIDDALHDLLMRRADVVDQVKDAKADSGGAIFRPGREAEILRRLADRHSGTLPRDVIIRMWRELVSAFVSLQGPFSVSVWDTGDVGCWDLARDHFGTRSEMTRLKSTRGVLHAVAEGTATAGVLPFPQEGEADPWWPALDVTTDKRLQICARLPFGSIGNGKGVRSGALVVTANDPEPSGDDHSFILIEQEESASRGGLATAFGDAGFDMKFIAGGSSSDALMLLAEINGFVTPDDKRLAACLENAPGVRSAHVVGAYAVPLGTTEIVGDTNS
ncbi:MAG: chorismate mutase [Rhodospirillaceae bacterium]|jgi:chorismate mutase-like protein|nr:chorismate mutase [Rhodospirillaceae bacterium]MBT5458271.1 chorismate mutase [Rhodospirillaceae bacterium]